MGNFKVDTGHLRSAARSLTSEVAPAYADSSTNINAGARVQAPGFGLALSWLEAIYAQQVDYLAKDLQGAHDVVNEIATRLGQTATEYEKGENLNIQGFDGKPQQEQSWGSEFGHIIRGDASGFAASGIVTTVTVDAIYGALVSMGVCATMCPAFIPATIAAATLVANVPSIWDAHSVLSNEGNRISAVVNAAFENACGVALDGWDGEGQLAFQNLTTKVKADLDLIGTYLGTLSSALTSLIVALAGFWVAIITLVGPFLLWLIAMTASEIFPLDIPVIETIKEAAGAAASAGIVSTVASVAAVGGVVFSLINGLLEKALDLSLPDGGKAGVPDMTEFHVNANFQTSL